MPFSSRIFSKTAQKGGILSSAYVTLTTFVIICLLVFPSIFWLIDTELTFWRIFFLLNFIFTFMLFALLKARQLCLQTSPNQYLTLIYNFTISQEWNLKPVTLELPGQHFWGHLPNRPYHFLKEGDLTTINSHFASSASFSSSFLPMKGLHLIKLLGASFCLLDGMLPDSRMVEIKPKTFKFTQLNFII